MKPMTIPKGGDNVIPVCAFDLSVEDINKRRSGRLKFESVQEAAQYFGIESRKRLETIIKNKTKVQKNEKYFAIRREDPIFDKPLTTSF